MTCQSDDKPCEHVWEYEMQYCVDPEFSTRVLIVSAWRCKKCHVREYNEPRSFHDEQNAFGMRGQQ